MTKLENFERAFDGHSGGCRRTCNCGREFYNPDPHWSWEEGEIDRLAESGATSLDYSVGIIRFEGVDYVPDCSCWRERAERIMGFIDSHARQIAEYLTLEKQLKQAEADAAPVVGGEADEWKCA